MKRFSMQLNDRLGVHSLLVALLLCLTAPSVLSFQVPVGLSPHFLRSSCSSWSSPIAPASGAALISRQHVSPQEQGAAAPRARGRASILSTNMMFDTLSGRFTQTLESLQGKKKISDKNIESALKDVRRSLLEADVNIDVATSLISEIRQRAIGMDVVEGVTPAQQFVKIMNEELTEILGSKQSPLARREEGLTTILMAGLQGTGKTTACGKLSLYCKSEDPPRKVLLVACDIYRPAAIEQLETLAKTTETEVFTKGTNADPIAIAREAKKYAIENGFDTMIVDTAGRQVIDGPLMNELKSIKNVVNPDEVLLVVDAMTGQEAANLTKAFNDAVGITGAILTKLDGDTRGGAALSIQKISGRPIKFAGVGEKVEALEPFYPERMASRILGMGDVVSMVEKAQKVVDEKEAERLAKKMISEKYDFDDFLAQSRQIKQMGSLGGMLKMMPGAGGVSPAQLAEAEERMKVAESLVCSMTKQERQDPSYLITDISGRSRIRRIAQGAGRSMMEAENFISDFQRMRQMMRNMGKMAMNQDQNPAAAAAGGPGQAPPGMALGNRSSRRAAKKGKGKSRPAAKGFGK